MDVMHPSKEFLESIDVHEVLPQQDPFVMIGRLVEMDEKYVTTETLVSETLLFVENGVLTATGIVENIAQTCAARIGYVNKYILKDEIRIGYIGAVRDFVVHRTPMVGDVIYTRIEVLEEVFGMTLVNAETTCCGDLIASAQMKIAIDREEKI